MVLLLSPMFHPKFPHLPNQKETSHLENGRHLFHREEAWISSNVHVQTRGFIGRGAQRCQAQGRGHVTEQGHVQVIETHPAKNGMLGGKKIVKWCRPYGNIWKILWNRNEKKRNNGISVIRYCIRHLAVLLSNVLKTSRWNFRSNYLQRSSQNA